MVNSSKSPDSPKSPEDKQAAEPGQKDWDAIRKKADALAAEEMKTPEATGEKAEKSATSETTEPETPESLTYPDHDALEAKLTEWEQKAHEYRDQAHRLAAELDNVQKRQMQELSKVKRFGTLNLAKDLVSLFDSFDAALATEGPDEGPFKAMQEGILMLRAAFMDTLKKHQVEEIDPIGGQFDPHAHEAIMMSPSDEKPGTILQVLQKGFQLHDRLLRPARVVVAKAKE